MDLTWPDELEDYRSYLRRWFAEHLQGRTFPRLRRDDTIAPLREWGHTLHQAGQPRGAGRSPWQRR